ncbi:hypothetical protein PI125_g781 [Phytophthora idaei]|nr:hypothetical protein PI125_g781 [Phytophthora idaei]
MEYEHGAENQPMDGNPSMCGPSETATHIARADCPHLSDPVGGTPKTGQSHWGDGRRDDATDVVTDRATRCCSGLHSQGASRRCYRYDYDGVVWDDTTRAVIETAREQLCGKRGGMWCSDFSEIADGHQRARTRLPSSCSSYKPSVM